jgi:hypothetical protein
MKVKINLNNTPEEVYETPFIAVPTESCLAKYPLETGGVYLVTEYNKAGLSNAIILSNINSTKQIGGKTMLVSTYFQPLKGQVILEN